MTMNEYQRLAQRTSNTETSEDKLINGVLGLSGEGGECADIVKKYKFQGHCLNKEHLAEELGDVMWYVAETATGIGMTLDDISEMNYAKLMKRYPNGFESERSINR